MTTDARIEAAHHEAAQAVAALSVRKTELAAIAAGDLPAYTAREVEQARRELVEMLAAEDARAAIREGGTAPWGDGETLPDMTDLCPRLGWFDPQDSVMRREVARIYDATFRATFDAEADSDTTEGREARIIEQGNGLDVSVGDEVYDGDALMRVVSVGQRIHTDDSRGNYVVARLEEADRDVTELSDADFADLPQVRVAYED